MANKGSDQPAVKAVADAYRNIDRNLRKLRGRDSQIRDGRLGQARYEVLNILSENQPIPAGELAGATGFTPASISRMLDPLVAEGVVQRIRSETDRRVVMVALTDQGSNLVKARRAYWSDRWATALEGVSAADLEITTEVMGRIAWIFVDPDPPVQPE
jgi:DNA-binding MarR family transcriptional regulator